eukprot:2775265-Pyramimonas_sp.AAC.1
MAATAPPAGAAAAPPAGASSNGSYGDGKIWRLRSIPSFARPPNWPVTIACSICIMLFSMLYVGLTAARRGGVTTDVWVRRAGMETLPKEWTQGPALAAPVEEFTPPKASSTHAPRQPM